MTRLLVSVRSASEALDALQGGAHLIDIKEPRHGALGAADTEVWRQVLRAVDGHSPVSAALGELLEPDCLSRAAETLGLSYVKAGLAGCAGDANWQFAWRRLKQTLPPCVRLVAVVYADFPRAWAPTPEAVLDAACELGLQTILIDTFDKSQGDLASVLPVERLRALLSAARQAGLQVALAGSLTEQSFPAALAYEPAWLAVRGAACEQGNRAGVVSARRVRRLVELLSPRVEITLATSIC